MAIDTATRPPARDLVLITLAPPPSSAIVRGSGGVAAPGADRIDVDYEPWGVPR